MSLTIDATVMLLLSIGGDQGNEGENEYEVQ